MSRVGKLPIPVPAGVKVEISGLNIKIQGPKGVLEKVFAGQISIDHIDGFIIVKPLSEEARAMWGTARSIINGMVKGVTLGFKMLFMLPMRLCAVAMSYLLTRS